MSTFFQELMRIGVYKRNQGRITRQVTAAVMMIVLAIGLYRLSLTLQGEGAAWQYVLPFTLFLAGLWIVYRAVNVPGFADFLIAVEAEMNKVSWPTRSELTRASLVVLVTIFSLAAVLAVYDLFWNVLFTKILKIY